MMFGAVPACSVPTVTTAASSGETRRLTSVCSWSTRPAAIISESVVSCG